MDPPEYLQASRAIIEVLSAPGIAESDMPLLVAATLGRQLHWPVVGVWLLHEREFLLRCAAFWCDPDIPLPEAFKKVSVERQFSLNEGLPGATWAQCKPQWVDDVREIPNFPRRSAAVTDHVIAAAAFPLFLRRGVLGLTENIVLGVIELLSRDSRQQDPAFLDFLLNLGGQIGLFLERARIRGELDRLRTASPETKIPEAVFVIDEQSNVLFANPDVITVFGYQPQEMVGQKLTMLMPPELVRRHEEGLRRYVQTGVRNVSWRKVILPARRKDGSEVVCEISFGEFFRGGKRVFTGFARPL
jgi:PAS domain S-box-containing protein